eukprot:11678011-Ditylum_brightwellii.AAC.1
MSLHFVMPTLYRKLAHQWSPLKLQTMHKQHLELMKLSWLHISAQAFYSTSAILVSSLANGYHPQTQTKKTQNG